MAADFADFSRVAPPQGLSPALEALWWLKKGGLETGATWERAHALAQGGEGDPACDRVHALVHWIEGDKSNAAYWFRRAGGEPECVDIAEEWAQQVKVLRGG
jgi:hypothetical protein